MSTGFSTSDPLANAGHGYRSHKLARKWGGSGTGPDQFLRTSDVSYNGFVFPPTMHATATVVPEYNAAKNAVMYHTVVLTIEAIITPSTQSIFTTSFPTIDSDMDNIRARLMQPCQPLSFTLQGFGTFKVQQNNFYDVNNGPKPQVLEWEPLGGGAAARIQWLVTTSIPPCGVDGSSTGLRGVLDFGYEISWNITDAGFLRRSVSAYIMLASTRKPNSGSIHASNAINLADNRSQYEQAIAVLRKAFPTLNGWHRDEDFKLSNDFRKLTLTFTDTEVPSPQAIPVGILRLSLTESLSSSLGNGDFVIWNWSITGDIEVPNSKKGSDIVNNKKIAFFAFGLILKDRLERARNRTYRIPTASWVDGAPSPGETEEQVHRTSVIPMRLSISNEMYGNSISIDVGFDLYCSTEILLAASGMFDAIRYPGLTWDNWRKFIEKSQSRVPFFDVIPNQEVVVDLCHPITSTAAAPKSAGDEKEPEGQTRQGLFGITVPPKEESWLEYNNVYSYKIKYFTVAGVLIDEQAVTYRSTEEIPTVNEEFALNPVTGITSAGDDSKFAKPDLSTAASAIVYVTMAGRATRIGYAINAPELISVGGKRAVKVGTDRLNPRSRSVGAAGSAGKRTNIYGLSWRKSYVIEGLPATWTIKDNAKKMLYTKQHPAY